MAMDNNKQQATRIQLTDEQRHKIQQATGKPAEAIELTVGELEDRISPGIKSGR
jgi:hypothetical protein